jgi:hypothetical protein
VARNLALRTIDGRERTVMAFATHADAFPWLILEHELASALVTAGAPVAPPLPETSPCRHPASGYVSHALAAPRPRSDGRGARPHDRDVVKARQR